MLYLKEESILEKTTKELRNRNKIIRIADKYGWDVVEEYTGEVSCREAGVPSLAIS
jgi:lipoprotein NlpI